MKAVNSDASVPGSEPSGRRSLLEDLYACPKCPRRFCSGRALGGHLAAHQRMDRTMEKEGDGSSVTSKYSPRVAFRAPAGQRVAPYYVSHMPHKYCNSSLPEKPAPPHLDLDITSNGFNSVVANAGKLVSKDSEPLDSTDAGLIPPPPATHPRVAFRNAGLLFNPADQAQFELLVMPGNIVQKKTKATFLWWKGKAAAKTCNLSSFLGVWLNLHRWSQTLRP